MTYQIKDDENTKKAKPSGMFAKIKSIKHIEIIIAVVVVAIMLLIYFTSFSSEASDDAMVTSNELTYYSIVKQELEEKLSLIDGAGEVAVLISWSESEEYVLAYSISSTGSSAVVTNGGEIFILKTIYPEPTGVVVICEGAGNFAIKLDIISAVSAYFGIDENIIIVLEMK